MQSRVTLDLLARFPGASVLDVGGGHGQTTGVLVEAGHRVTILGSDPSCEARVREWTRAGRAAFVAGDLLDPGLPDRSFDVVLSYRLLPHARRFEDLVATLARLARLAVVVDYPTRRSLNAAADAFFGLKKDVERDTRPFRVFADDGDRARVRRARPAADGPARAVLLPDGAPPRDRLGRRWRAGSRRRRRPPGSLASSDRRSS